jgi:hypothetical protein
MHTPTGLRGPDEGNILGAGSRARLKPPLDAVLAFEEVTDNELWRILDLEVK